MYDKSKRDGAPLPLKNANKPSGFFNTPSWARDLIFGAGIGLIVVGVTVGAILLSVGTAGIGSLILGTATAAALGATGTGLSLGAISLGIVGVFSASFAFFANYFRSKPEKVLPKSVLPQAEHEIKTTNPLAEISKTRSAKIVEKTEPKAPQVVESKPVFQAKPSEDKKFIAMFQELYTNWDKHTKIAIGLLSEIGNIIGTKEFGGQFHTPLFKELRKDLVTRENPEKNFGKFDTTFQNFILFIENHKEYENHPEVKNLLETYKELVAIKEKYINNQPQLTAVFNQCKFRPYPENVNHFTPR